MHSSITHTVPVAEACTATTVNTAPPTSSAAGAATDTATGIDSESADAVLASDGSCAAAGR